MPIRWENSKYSPKVKAFLSKDPLKFPLLTLLDGAVRSGKTTCIIQKIPQIFDVIGNSNLKVFSGYTRMASCWKPANTARIYRQNETNLKY